MSTHTLDEAKERLSDLVRRAQAGEEVVLTENGRPVAELRPADGMRTAAPLSADVLDRLRRRRNVHPPGTGEALMGALLRSREEDWH